MAGLDLRSETRVLDVACGPGNLANLAARWGCRVPSLNCTAFYRCLWFGLFLLTLNLATGAPPVKPAVSTGLNPGDIVRSDAGDGIQGPFIIKVNPQTGAETILSQGGYLAAAGRPMGVVYSPASQIIVANQASLLRLDPLTGAQTLIRDTTGAPGGFWSLAMESDGNVLVAAESAILRVNPATGDLQTVSSGAQLNATLSLALGSRIYATSVRYEAGLGWVGSILRVDPNTGKHTVVSEGGNLGFLLGIAVEGDDLFVTGVKGHDDNFGIGQVVHVDARKGTQTVVSQGGYLMRPVGISLDNDGQVVVADPYTIHPENSDRFDGAIIRINPATGEQALVARGHDSCVDPCAVTVVAAAKGN